MRKLGLQYSLTANLYREGWSVADAMRKGASISLWEILEDRYGGERNIPESDWLGSHHCEHSALAHTPTGYAY